MNIALTAAEHGHTAGAKLLLDKNADVSLRMNPAGRRPYGLLYRLWRWPRCGGEAIARQEFRCQILGGI